jgi:C4-dicarboxylate transporter DctQ subunit
LLTDGVAGLAVAAIVVVVLVQVAGRLLGVPFSWTEELTRACFIWMVFSGIAATTRHADAARVTVLLGYLPRFIRRAALPIYVACSLAFFGLTVWTGWYMVRQQVNMNEQIATLGWPSWVVGVIVPASAVLSILGLLQSLRTHRAAIAVTDDVS